MKKLIATLLLFTFLSGCLSSGGYVSSSSRNSSPSSKCSDYGHTEGTEAYATCIGNETRAAEERAQERRIAAAQSRAARQRAFDRMVWDDDW